MTIDEHAAAAKEHLRQMVKEIEVELGFNTALPLLQAMDAIDRVAGKWARLTKAGGER